MALEKRQSAGRKGHGAGEKGMALGKRGMALRHAKRGWGKHYNRSIFLNKSDQLCINIT